MIYDPEVETRPIDEQYALDREQYRKQIALSVREFRLLPAQAGRGRVSNSPEDVGGLDDIAQLPFTEKDEIRATQANEPPFGAHLAADPGGCAACSAPAVPPACPATSA
jgi:phenylacetate-CoA ligase